MDLSISVWTWHWIRNTSATSLWGTLSLCHISPLTESPRTHFGPEMLLTEVNKECGGKHCTHIASASLLECSTDHCKLPSPHLSNPALRLPVYFSWLKIGLRLGWDKVDYDWQQLKRWGKEIEEKKRMALKLLPVALNCCLYSSYQAQLDFQGS